MSKITKATIKSFIKNNFDKLYINVKSEFDGMTDCVMSTGDTSFSKVQKSIKNERNNLGVIGAWFVGSSRDYFDIYEDEGFKGFKIYNCCGSFILALQK